VEYAESAIPRDLTLATGFDYLRATALLAVTGIQLSQVRSLHRWMGAYLTLVAMDSLHDEAKWDQKMGVIEREERRRLFWSMYTLEVYSSIVFGGIIRCRELQSLIRFPVEVDDEYITEEGIGVQPVDKPSWIRGWNYTTTRMMTLRNHFAKELN
jgi:hypothetical protein